MDLEYFLELEKRMLDEERQLLNGQSYNAVNSLISTVNTKASMARDNKKTTHTTEETPLSKTTKDWINNQYDNRTENVQGSKTSLEKKLQMVI